MGHGLRRPNNGGPALAVGPAWARKCSRIVLEIHYNNFQLNSLNLLPISILLSPSTFPPPRHFHPLSYTASAMNSRLVEPKIANLPNQDMTEPARTNTGDQQSCNNQHRILYRFHPLRTPTEPSPVLAANIYKICELPIDYPPNFSTTSSTSSSVRKDPNVHDEGWTFQALSLELYVLKYFP